MLVGKQTFEVPLGSGAPSFKGATSASNHQATDRLPTTAAGFNLPQDHDLAERQPHAALISIAAATGQRTPHAQLRSAWARVECALSPEVVTTCGEFSRSNLFRTARRTLEVITLDTQTSSLA